MSTQLSPSQIISNRTTNQVNRTEWGVQNGTISPQRGARIEARDARIEARAQTDAANNGGNPTCAQDARLLGALNRTSGAIHNFNQGQYPGPMLPTH